jgi:hypothetical protein
VPALEFVVTPLTTVPAVAEPSAVPIYLVGNRVALLEASNLLLELLDTYSLGIYLLYEVFEFSLLFFQLLKALKEGISQELVLILN